MNYGNRWNMELEQNLQNLKCSGIFRAPWKSLGIPEEQENPQWTGFHCSYQKQRKDVSLKEGTAGFWGRTNAFDVWPSVGCMGFVLQAAVLLSPQNLNPPCRIFWGQAFIQGSGCFQGKEKNKIKLSSASVTAFSSVLNRVSRSFFRSSVYR